MKHIRLSIVLTLLVGVVAACSATVTATLPRSTPTDPPPTATAPASAPTQASGLLLTPTPSLETLVEPGGVDVAMTLVVIPDQETIALVNGEEISSAFYKEELENALNSVTAQYGVDWNDPQNDTLLPRFQDQVLDQIIDLALLKQLASAEGIAVTTEEIDAEIETVRAQIAQDQSFLDWESFLAANNLTDVKVRSLVGDQLLIQALTDKHGGPSVVEQVHASHILVATEETGQEVLDKLDDGEEFGALAAEYSTDPGSKDQGGDLGWFPPGMMVPEFETAAFALEPGEISDLVQSDFGYHIILVHAKEEREMDPDLLAQVQQQQFQVWFEAQQAAAEIERLFSFQTVE